MSLFSFKLALVGQNSVLDFIEVPQHSNGSGSNNNNNNLVRSDILESDLRYGNRNQYPKSLAQVVCVCVSLWLIGHCGCS